MGIFGITVGPGVLVAGLAISSLAFYFRQKAHLAGNDPSQIVAQKQGLALWPPVDVDPSNP